MDALIFTCGTGGGHNTACEAMKEALSLRGHGVETLNPYLLKGEKTADAVDNAYIGLARKAPSAFGMVYQIGNAYRNLPVLSPVYYLNRGVADLVKDYIRDSGCDAVLTTHLFPAEMLTHLKRTGESLPPAYFIATDYTCIPFTEETECDYYIIPARELTDEFVERGIPEEKLIPLGMPVRRSFSEKIGRDEARKRLGLDPYEKIILISGGSIGAGKIREIVRALADYYRDAVRLIVVCGNNEYLYRNMEREFGDRCALVRYTSQMRDYMAACDLFITKPGGLSSTEAAVVGVPMIHVAPIPGCENRNMDFFEKNGMSIAIRSGKKQLLTACDSLLSRSAQSQMIENQRRVISAGAADDICDFIEQTYASPT